MAKDTKLDLFSMIKTRLCLKLVFPRIIASLPRINVLTEVMMYGG